MIEIKQQYLTENDCYKAGRKITPTGIMVHSTGANNPYIMRYVQPDDGIIGKNVNNNDWNRSGVDKCVHAFIGRDKNGVVRIYQTLPFNHRGWHAGGNANNTHISFEICEDSLISSSYFYQVINKAIELCVYLCEQYNIKPEDIIDHSEGSKLGIASNHSDISHWLKRYNMTMDDFRQRVKEELESGEEVRYKFLKDVPEGEFHEVIKNLVDTGAIKGYGGSGENTEIDLSEDMVRILVIDYRSRNMLLE